MNQKSGLEGGVQNSKELQCIIRHVGYKGLSGYNLKG